MIDIAALERKAAVCHLLSDNYRGYSYPGDLYAGDSTHQDNIPVSGRLFAVPGDVRAAHSKTAHVHCLAPVQKLVFSN